MTETHFVLIQSATAEVSGTPIEDDDTETEE
jgi:hypothetical protein